MKSMDQEARAELERRGLPDPPAGEITRWRYSAGCQDWYVFIAGVWHHLAGDRPSSGWRPLPYGPIDYKRGNNP